MFYLVSGHSYATLKGRHLPAHAFCELLFWLYNGNVLTGETRSPRESISGESERSVAAHRRNGLGLLGYQPGGFQIVVRNRERAFVLTGALGDLAEDHRALLVDFLIFCHMYLK